MPKTVVAFLLYFLAFQPALLQAEPIALYIGEDNFRKFAAYSDRSLFASPLITTATIKIPRETPIPLNAYDHIVVDELLYGQFGRQNQNQSIVIAFIDTMAGSYHFKSPEIALKYFDDSYQYYKSLENTPDFGELVRGALKSGFKLGYSGAQAYYSGSLIGLDGLVESGVDLYGTLYNAHRKDLSEKADNKFVNYQKYLEGVALQAALNPEMARPILKKILSQNSDISDEEYRRFVANLPANKNDIVASRSNTEGVIAKSVEAVVGRMQALTQELASLKKQNSGQEKQIKQIEAELKQLGDQLQKLTELSSSIQGHLSKLIELSEKKIDAARRELEAKEISENFRNIYIVAQNIATLTKMNPKSVNYIMNGLRMMESIALAAVTKNPGAIAAAATYAAVLFFGRDSGPDLAYQELFNRIEALRMEMHEQFQSVHNHLGKIDNELEELEKVIVSGLHHVLVGQGNISNLMTTYSEKLISEITAVRHIVDANYQRDTSISWGDLAVGLATYQKAFFLSKSTTPDKAITYELNLLSAQKDLNKSFQRVLGPVNTNASLQRSTRT